MGYSTKFNFYGFLTRPFDAEAICVTHPELWSEGDMLEVQVSGSHFWGSQLSSCRRQVHRALGLQLISNLIVPSDFGSDYTYLRNTDWGHFKRRLLAIQTGKHTQSLRA